MNTSFIAILIIFLLVVAAFALMILNGRKAERSTFEQKIQKSWGTECPRLFSQEEMDAIRRYSDSLDEHELRADGTKGACSRIDEITAKDVDLDTVFAGISGSILSSPGAEVLYAFLRHPLLDRDELAKRIAWEDALASSETERIEVQRALYEISFLKGGSFYQAIRSLKDAAPIGRSRFLALGLMTLAAIVLLFFQPLIGVAVLVPLLIADYRVHVGMKERTLTVLRAFQAVELLREGAQSLIRSLPEQAFSKEKQELAEGVRALNQFHAGSFLVTSGGSVGAGIMDAVLEYVKLFFHVDLIQFDRMLEAVADHETDILRLFELIGSVDAASAAASYLRSLSLSCRPEFSSLSEGKELRIRGLAHPLLKNPVRNDILTESSVLLTGSNASGKSTFLKAAALAAILAQSIGVVCAGHYRAPFFRIFSSMALSDNLFRGESYFIVELKSLKRILDASDADGAPVLAFIDEVLRGTNTIERIAASSQILKEIGTSNALVFAATHDIELSYLLAGSYENMHFQESTAEGDLHFDYLLRKGRAEAGNAIALLKKWQYPEGLVADAGLMVKRFEESGVWSMESGMEGCGSEG